MCTYPQAPLDAGKFNSEKINSSRWQSKTKRQTTHNSIVGVICRLSFVQRCAKMREKTPEVIWSKCVMTIWLISIPLLLFYAQFHFQSNLSTHLFWSMATIVLNWRNEGNTSILLSLLLQLPLLLYCQYQISAIENKIISFVQSSE